jgi:acyl dehydratase
MTDHSASRLTVATLQQLVGQSFVAPEWTLIDQDRVNTFAACTGDHQFIHVDPERVRRDTPFPGTIAHGYLLLSLAANHRQQILPPVQDVAMVLNYGLDRLRFINPVQVGSRVRYRTLVLAAEPRSDGRVLLRQEATLVISGQEKPALIAEVLALYIPK